MPENFDNFLDELASELKQQATPVGDNGLSTERRGPTENGSSEGIDLVFGSTSDSSSSFSLSGSLRSQVLKDNEFTDNDSLPFVLYTPELNFKKDVIGFVEQYYHENYSLPSPKDLQLRFRGYAECPRYLQNWNPILASIKEQLSVRGLPEFNESQGYLAPEFVTAVHLILNYQDRRTIPAKLKSIGVTTAKWSSWLKKPKYKEYYKEKCQLIFTDEFQAEAQRSLMNSVVAGDLQAVKYYNEVTGIYRPQESATQNVIATLITALFEILTRHVSAEVIASIGAEIREAPSVIRVMGAIEAETNSDIKERMRN